MQAGLFILPSEAALASSLLQGGAWLPPSFPQSPLDQPLGEPPLLCGFRIAGPKINIKTLDRYVNLLFPAISHAL